jgi:hypothetical protein
LVWFGWFIPVAPTWSTGHPWNASCHFLNLRHSVGLLGRVISPSQGCYLTQTQTSIPRMVFEPTIPAFERRKTVNASDRAATVIGYSPVLPGKCLDGASKICPDRFCVGRNPLATLHLTFRCSRVRITDFFIFSHCYELSCHIILPKYTYSVNVSIRWADFFRRMLFLCP